MVGEGRVQDAGFKVYLYPERTHCFVRLLGPNVPLSKTFGPF